VPRGDRQESETYQHWAASGATITREITRDELLALVERYWVHPPVNSTTLRNWEREKILPHPRLAKHIDGLTRALYPVWAVTMIMELRHEQAKGRVLKDLRVLMRESARRCSLLHAEADPTIPREKWLPAPPRIYDEPPLNADMLTHGQRNLLVDIVEMALFYQEARTEEDPYAVKLSPFASWLRTVEDVKLVLTAPDGTQVTIPVPLDPDFLTE